MAIPSRQIGGSTRSNLLWQISKQLEHLICVRSCGCGGNTTTTTSSSSTTTTSTTFFSREYCVWSTNPFQGPIETSEYNVTTNTLTNVPIDNDLINPNALGMASISTKLWKHNPATRIIREWFINSYPASLTFNRDITYQSNYPNYVNISTIAAVDNNTILTTLNATNQTYPNGVPGQVFLWKYNISTNNASSGTPLFAITATNYAASMMYTTDSKLIVCASRLIDDVPTYYLTQYSYPDGAKEVDISLASIPFNPSAQLKGFFVITYNNEIYLIRTYDSSLFKVDNIYPYAITEVTADLGFDQHRIFESSTGECNNVSFVTLFPECGTSLPLLGGSFTYFGNTVTNTAWSGGVQNLGGTPPYPIGYLGCTGLWMPPVNIVFTGGPSALVSYTLTFDIPINSIGLIFGAADTGDTYTFTTDTDIPTIGISTACYMSVSGNTISTDPGTNNGEGNGLFIISTTTPFTVLTLNGVNEGNGVYIGVNCDPCCSLPNVTIGDQIWTGCNLGVTKYQTGTPTLSLCGESCGTTLNGNVLEVTYANPNGGASLVQVGSTNSYTQITITGPGGGDGSTISLCLDDVTPPLDCTSCNVIPLPNAIVGGIGTVTYGDLIINTTYSGPTLNNTGDFITCTGKTTPLPCLILGNNVGDFTYTLNFNKPVNNIKLLFAGGGAAPGSPYIEYYTFTTNDGDEIPQVQNPAEWSELTTGAWCYYNNDADNGCTYGKLYNWYAVNDPRGLAPSGYHIPSETEVLTLQSYLGGNSVAGGKLKEVGTVHWNSPNTGATNESSWTALPGGAINSTGTWAGLGNYGSWWTTTPSIGGTSVFYQMFYNTGGLLIQTFSQISGYSIRLISDTPASTTTTTTLAPTGFNTIYTSFEVLTSTTTTTLPPTGFNTIYTHFESL